MHINHFFKKGVLFYDDLNAHKPLFLKSVVMTPEEI